MDSSPSLKRWQRWTLVAILICFLIAGQTAAVLLGRFYYDQGGKSKWIATLVQTVGFPILFIPLFFLQPSPEISTSSSSPQIRILVLIYSVLGALGAAEGMLYSVGLSYLSASTYSILCAIQVAFNVVFSYLFNSQKFTVLILNSVVILSLSAALIAVDDDSKGPSSVSKTKFIIGFLSALGASALDSLTLSLTQLSFEKVLKKETFRVVLELQIYTSVFISCVSMVGLFARGEWKNLQHEMHGFEAGKVSYVLTLFGTAIAWQVCDAAAVGLIFLVSSLFSNVISTLSFVVTPLAAVVLFHDKMNGIKVISMLLALCGSASYIYQNHLDDIKARRTQTDVQEP